MIDKKYQNQAHWWTSQYADPLNEEDGYKAHWICSRTTWQNHLNIFGTPVKTKIGNNMKHNLIITKEMHRLCIGKGEIKQQSLKLWQFTSGTSHGTIFCFSGLTNYNWLFLGMPGDRHIYKESIITFDGVSCCRTSITITFELQSIPISITITFELQIIRRRKKAIPGLGNS